MEIFPGSIVSLLCFKKIYRSYGADDLNIDLVVTDVLRLRRFKSPAKGKILVVKFRKAILSSVGTK